jgi:hypothetical protein
VYVFDWRDGEIKEAECPACGNEEVDHFASADDIDELEQSWSARRNAQRSYYTRKPGVDGPR